MGDLTEFSAALSQQQEPRSLAELTHFTRDLHQEFPGNWYVDKFWNTSLWYCVSLVSPFILFIAAYADYVKRLKP